MNPPCKDKNYFWNNTNFLHRNPKKSILFCIVIQKSCIFDLFDFWLIIHEKNCRCKFSLRIIAYQQQVKGQGIRRNWWIFVVPALACRIFMPWFRHFDGSALLTNYMLRATQLNRRENTRRLSLSKAITVYK